MVHCTSMGSRPPKSLMVTIAACQAVAPAGLDQHAALAAGKVISMLGVYDLLGNHSTDPHEIALAQRPDAFAIVRNPACIPNPCRSCSSTCTEHDNVQMTRLLLSDRNERCLPRARRHCAGCREYGPHLGSDKSSPAMLPCCAAAAGANQVRTHLQLERIHSGTLQQRLLAPQYL